MTNLKNEILHTLQENKSIEKFFDKISKYQNNLIKNHSNPVFNESDKVKLLNIYNTLQELGKVLYRYNILKSNNLNFKDEQKKLENIVLKGGISNIRCIWKSEHDEHTCKECLELDGQELNVFDDVPERPHPNCKCSVEIVEYIDDNTLTQNNEEPCNLVEYIETFINNLENVINNNKLKITGYESYIHDIENSKLKIQDILQDTNSILDILKKRIW